MWIHDMNAYIAEPVREKIELLKKVDVIEGEPAAEEMDTS